jgi:O-antigen ligase
MTSAVATPAVRGAARGFDALHLVLVGVLLSYVWRVQDLVPGLAALKVPTIATALAAAMLALDRRVGPQLARVRSHRLWQLVPVFAGIATVSVAFSIAFGISADFLARSLLPSVALATVVPLTIFAIAHAERFAAVQVAGATLYCVVILAEFDAGTGRLASLVYYDANDLGMLLACTLPLSAYFARHARRAASRAAAVATLVLFVFAIARTGSRGAFLGLIAAGVVLVVRRGPGTARRVATVAAVVAVLALGAGARYWGTIGTILHPTRDYNWSGGSDAGRMAIWARGAGYVADRPLTGVGLAAFPVAEGTLSRIAARQEYGRGVKWSAAHNSFVQVAAELGVPGLLVFCAMLAVAFGTARRLARDAAAAPRHAARRGSELAHAHAAAVAAFVVSGSFLSQAYAPYLYFMLGMIIGLDASVRAELAASAAPAPAARRIAAWRVRHAAPAPDGP